MTVTQSYSLSLTYTSLRMYLSQSAPAPVPAKPENTPAGDTANLSPGATAPPAVDETPASTQLREPASGSGSSEEPSSSPSSRAARRAETLLDALDADQDGAVTKEEFLDGAMALLRRAGARNHHRHHGVHDGPDRHAREGHGAHRLERKLDRLFDRVDGSGDGSIDQAELTQALAKVTHERRPEVSEVPAPSQEAHSPAPSAEGPSTSPSPETSAPDAVPYTPPAAAIAYTSVTVVIAVKQYASVAAMNA